ncbi:7-methylguanosine phosphate-specific 5'-nucleotidase A-like isoform X3 [Dreissena polymorpha]|uniref:7-methylguanosine phosphate-specific 5'-nucleotidase A-like isoform X3 n=1 Tax=Dreissena polymorpha TaxID=45954 RepID=UPI002264C5F2|nr:7-methylguanosine phosphate-specific 5'-nucleotidase A-like isoform X3 [Dreissena polymorpha]XP_052234727.1 7-methylguanosine phosphate-specific 5'-nucleotidase A-like isoform X3 [Dreissena polymorpha]
MECLNKPHVHVRDREHVERILAKMVADGPNKLQVCSDFDSTITNYKGACTYNVLEEGGLPEEYKEEAYKLRDKYFVIEVDPNMTIEEKTPYMVEWWTKAHELLMKYPLSKAMLHNMVANSSARLRDGCIRFFDSLHSNDIPLLIFSAGVGDVIQEVIAQQSTLYDNMHIVSNFIDFDENGTLIGFKSDIIHVYNKNENAVHDSDYFPNLSHRTNLLLMGDSLGDLQMANGAESLEAKLTIGFLNTRVTESLALYISKYDIVICEDETMDIVNNIVSNILASV